MDEMLKEFKVTFRLSLQDLANIMQVSKTTANRYLKGEQTIPRNRLELIKKYISLQEANLEVFYRRWGHLYV